ncbi:unnamed protein product [Cylicocyclus nassatus]|uniref:Transmembrane protein 144 n=1 Tax=Cylicocyclus nassatus TaxID=53992 RepID=A0AA36DNA8_CYLNA|nr:unnamed protein product [Cylicocyclus nassatus]
MWVTAMAILCVGFLVFWQQAFPGFYPLAMLGGFFWAIGNAPAAPVMHRIGVSVGPLIWNSAKCITGWFTGRFGLLGMKPTIPASKPFNYAGLAFVILGCVIFSLVKIQPSHQQQSESEKSKESEENGNAMSTVSISLTREDSRECDQNIGNKEKALCFGIAVCVGICYGLTFVPVVYILDNPDKYPDHPKEALAYVFSNFFGIFLTANAIFIAYAVKRGKEAYVHTEIVLPSFLSGLSWAIAQSSFFIAVQHLSQAISFPIVTALPSCIASVWGIVYFKEIKGRRSITVFGIAFAVSVIGAIMVGLSKEIEI